MKAILRALIFTVKAWLFSTFSRCTRTTGPLAHPLKRACLRREPVRLGRFPVEAQRIVRKRPAEVQRLCGSAFGKHMSIDELADLVCSLKSDPVWKLQAGQALTRVGPVQRSIILSSPTKKEMVEHLDMLIAQGAAAQGGTAAGGAAARGGLAAGGTGGAAASQDPAPVQASGPFDNVSRLKYRGETVGSASLVQHPDHPEPLVVTARHCLNPEPGAPIGTEGVTAFDQELRHCVSYPFHGLTVLRLKDASALKGVTPFKLAGGLGLFRRMAICVVGYPLAADVSIPDTADSDQPVRSAGIVSRLMPCADLAVGDYKGDMPSSGAAVVISQFHLAGCHLCAVNRKERQSPRDSAPRKDQQEAQPASTTTGGGGACSATKQVNPDAMETSTWTTADTESMSKGACGSQEGASRKRKGAGGEGGSANIDAAKRDYCVQNVEHKGSLGYFVPARTLSRLLDKYKLEQQGRCMQTQVLG